MTYRITSLHIKRPLLNRLAWWFYDKFCGEPYIPEGRKHLRVVIGNSKCLGWDGRETHATLSFIPKKFIPGVHELLITEVEIIK